MSLQHLYVVTGCWRDSTSSPVPPKSNVSLHNTLFLCILHNVWLGFLIFIFYIGDTTTSITLFSLSLILYAIFPSLFRNTVALHTFQRKEQLILQWSLEEIRLERFLHISVFIFGRADCYLCIYLLSQVYHLLQCVRSFSLCYLFVIFGLKLVLVQNGGYSFRNQATTFCHKYEVPHCKIYIYIFFNN